MKLNYYVLYIAIIGLSACTWVEPTVESNEVTLVKPFNVKSCKLLKTATVTVTHKVGIINRDKETVREELITLAKNKAAEMGGDSIVELQPVAEGAMKYEVYQCRE
jgi:hypothetical protein